MKFVCTLFIACCLTNAAISQSILRPTIDIDVRSGAFTTSLPFDEPFNIRGELAYSTRRVILKYGPVDVEKERKYFATAKAYGKSAKNNADVEQLREYFVKTGETEFLFSEIGPLRPNLAYKFNFLTLAKNTISDNELVFLKQELDKKITNTFSSNKPLNLQNMADMFDELLTMSSEITHEDNFVDAKSEPFKIDTYKKSLNFFSYRLLDTYSEISANKGKILSILDSTGSNSLYNGYQQITPKLIAINSGSIPLSDYSKQVLTTAATGNARQAISLLQSTLSNKAEFKQMLLSGAYTSSAVPDSSTINTLQNLLNILNAFSLNEFTKTDRSKVFTFDDINAINNISSSINSILNYQTQLARANLNLLSLKAALADVVIHAYREESYILSSAAEVTVIPKANPYVSFDLGAGINYNPYKNSEGRIGNNTYFSINEGVNIYFSPVNKKVPLSTFKWPYNFYKSFNIHVGLAQFLGGYSTYRFSNSLGWIGNLVAGVGLRFNNTARVGLNVTFVNLKNINPTVSQSVIKPMFGLGFSFDINAPSLFNKKNRELK
ncbi:hypothetical protein [Spirosoma sp. KNUC1025]|uniref:hypothetical protein n=1 Tax=Spirosoma sp. KNUC1025 TaxID=2894082 RepID=UPI0038709B61|nr:porin family protein [Spirosoma sp. KNUC1025]